MHTHVQRGRCREGGRDWGRETETGSGGGRERGREYMFKNAQGLWAALERLKCEVREFKVSQGSIARPRMVMLKTLDRDDEPAMRASSHKEARRRWCADF